MSFASDIPKRLNGALEDVNYNIWGPFKVSSLDGVKYFITFVYEHTRMLRLYTINLKSEALEVFINSKPQLIRGVKKQ